MPCKKGPVLQAHGKPERQPFVKATASDKIPKQKIAALWKLMSPQAKEWNRLPRKIMKIEGKGYNSMTHYDLAHKFFPMPQEMKIQDARAASG